MISRLKPHDGTSMLEKEDSFWNCKFLITNLQQSVNITVRVDTNWVFCCRSELSFWNGVSLLHLGANEQNVDQGLGANEQNDDQDEDANEQNADQDGDASTLRFILLL